LFNRRILGSGKTSLLNILAGRIATNAGAKVNVDGNIYTLGKAINPAKFRRNIAFVTQENFLFSTSTPRECLRFSARLRLPPTCSSEDIDLKVETLLASLGITKCADTLIGNELTPGISGGEKKRTAVGVELITDPDLLFLDEPTSGLDSHTAFDLIKLLKTLATRCATLVTIHQPSSQIFFSFDKIIYIKGGSILCQGTVPEVLSHFSAKGYAIPASFNPSDYIMDLMEGVPMKELTANGLTMPVPTDDFIYDLDTSKSFYLASSSVDPLTAPCSPKSPTRRDSPPSLLLKSVSSFSFGLVPTASPSPTHGMQRSPSITRSPPLARSRSGSIQRSHSGSIHRTLSRTSSVLSGKTIKEFDEFEFESSFWRQFYYLYHREVVKTLRDKALLRIRFASTVVGNIFTGLIFYGIGSRDYGNASDFNSHIGGIMMILLFALIGTSQATVISFTSERPIVLNESATGTCKKLFIMNLYFSYTFF
jgi:ABC-type multidrug transport system ATPase subunit